MIFPHRRVNQTRSFRRGQTSRVKFPCENRERFQKSMEYITRFLDPSQAGRDSSCCLSSSESAEINIEESKKSLMASLKLFTGEMIHKVFTILFHNLHHTKWMTCAGNYRHPLLFNQLRTIHYGFQRRQLNPIQNDFQLKLSGFIGSEPRQNFLSK